MKKTRKMKKFVRRKVRKYGLRSQRRISFMQAEKLLKANGIVLNERNKNCLFLHNCKESMQHWLIKAIVFKLLRERGRTVGAEIEVRNGIVDLIDVDNLIAYEIESRPNKRRCKQRLGQLHFLHDVFMIDANKVPMDFDKAEKYLKDKIV